MRRLLFAGVLVAPTHLGGLGLTRRRVRELTWRELRDLLPQVGRDEDPAACAACAVAAWVEVLECSHSWSVYSVRSLLSRPPGEPKAHRHPEDDLPTRLWPDHAALLPAVDQWGYVDQHASLHPSSLSVLVRGLRELLAMTALPEVEADPLPEPSRHFSPEEQAEVFARADEANARIARILAEMG